MIRDLQIENNLLKGRRNKNREKVEVINLICGEEKSEVEAEDKVGYWYQKTSTVIQSWEEDEKNEKMRKVKGKRKTSSTGHNAKEPAIDKAKIKKQKRTMKIK